MLLAVQGMETTQELVLLAVEQTLAVVAAVTMVQAVMVLLDTLWW
jgi:hypothetical protein